MNEGVFYILGIAIGVLIGLWIAWGIEKFSTDSSRNQIQKAIEVCESHLPRYQHCVIKGVVKE